MSSWYLIASKPKQEFRAKENLENQGVKVFLPTIELQKVIRGKRQMVTEALFPNYLFIQLEDGDATWSKIRSTRGVRDFVKFGLKVPKVPKLIVSQLSQNLPEVDISAIKSSAPEKGQKVKVLEGAFKDLEGVFKKANGEERSIIMLNILHKFVEIDLANTNVIKL